MTKLMSWTINDLSRLMSPPSWPPPSLAARTTPGANGTARRSVTTHARLPIHRASRRDIRRLPRGPVILAKVCENYHASAFVSIARLPLDDTPAHDALALIEDDRLARRDGSLRLVEDDFDGAVAERPHHGRRRPVLVPDFCLDPERRDGRVAGDEVHRAGHQPVALELLHRAHHERVALPVDVDDVERVARGEPEPSPLADRVRGDALVPAEDFSLTVHDRARTEDRGVAPPQEASVVIVRHEADLLALRLVGRNETEPARVGPHLGLGQLADGETRGGELHLREGPEKVRLILLRVSRAQQDVTTARRVAGDARVVPRRDGDRVPCPRARQERAELQVAVAGNAGHGGPSAAVLVGEAGDDRALERVLHVEEIVRNAQPPGDVAGIVHGLRSAAAPEALRRVRRLGPRPDAHGDADDVVALLHEQGRGDGGIDTPAHSHNDALRHAAPRPQCRAPSNPARRSSSSGFAYTISILPFRSLPTILTRVMSVRWNWSSSAASSGERRRPFFGAAPCCRPSSTTARIESSVALTDQSCSRISFRSRSWSAAVVSASRARACPIVSRPLRRSAWISSGSRSRRNAFAIELRSRPMRPASSSWVQPNWERSFWYASASSIGFRSSRSRFSTSASSRLWASVASRTIAGIRSSPAWRAARQRRSPAMSW